MPSQSAYPPGLLMSKVKPSSANRGLINRFFNPKGSTAAEVAQSRYGFTNYPPYYDLEGNLKPARGLLYPLAHHMGEDFLPYKEWGVTPTLVKDALTVVEAGGGLPITPEEVFEGYMGPAGGLISSSIARGALKGSVDPSTLRMFAGEGAKTADKTALKTAKEMSEAGANRDKIWEETGWFKDKDDWKFEISDDLSRVRDTTVKPTPKPESLPPGVTSGATSGVPLSEFADNVLSHPELFKAYTRPSYDSLKSEMRQVKSTIDYYYAVKQNSGKQGYEEFTPKMARELPQLEEQYKKLWDLSIDFKQGLSAVGVRSDIDKGLWETRGRYSPERDNIEVSSPTKGDEYKSTLLHELQHAIQHRENFAKGGNPELAPTAKIRTAKEDLQRLGGYEKLKAYDDAHREWAELASMDSIHHFFSIKQPRQLFGSQPWYKYSGEIRNELGPPPKRSGQKRKDWIDDAGRFIANKLILEHNMRYPTGNVYDKYRNAFKSADDRRLFKNTMNRARYALDKFDWSEMQALRKAKEIIADLESKSQTSLPFEAKYEIYRRLAGEAEARNVQTRMDFSPQQRKETPPWRTLDVPEDELIYSKEY